MPAQVLKDMVCGPLEDVRQVAWSCWHTSLTACLTNHIPEEGTLGSSTAESIDSGARHPPCNLGLVS